ncbi:MAG: restriction endonuclease subunit S [Gammaproteobacteria bacterium]|nr:MAG: restriction endonuclease subunit S [Gammaproteobacteria bacterium]
MKQYESQFRKLTEVGTVNRGKSKHRPRNAPELYGGSYPFIQTGDVKHANFYITEYVQTYSEKGLAQSKLWQPGTLCITIAANIADTAILKIPACFPDSIIGFIPEKGKSEVRFIKYCLDTYKKEMQLISQGTTQDNLSQGKLLSLRFRIPDYDQQQKIAAILSAYDELIENSQRRIALLEKMAEEIYREWFVRLRFPGHKKIKLESRPLRDFVQEYIGGDWGEDMQGSKFANPVYVIRGTDFEGVLQGNISSVPLRYVKDSSLRSRKLRVGDLIVENSVNHQSRTAGKSLLITQHLLDLFDGDAICASFCKLIRPKNTKHSKLLSLNFRLLFEQGLFEYFQNVATNGIANLQAERLLDRHLIFFHENIDLQILDSFDTSLLARVQANLRQTRDQLLPRLISGKLAVEHLDIRFPPGMEDRP